MSDATDRHGLALLQVGQAQKEVTHNEALIRIDALLHLAVESRTTAAPPVEPTAGQAWIIPDEPNGAWTGRAGHIACWQDGGWMFIEPTEGCLAWVKAEGVFALYAQSEWRANAWPVRSLLIDGLPVLTNRQPAIMDPLGGMVVDMEVRVAVGQVLSALRAHGLIGI